MQHTADDIHAFMAAAFMVKVRYTIYFVFLLVLFAQETVGYIVNKTNLAG